MTPTYLLGWIPFMGFLFFPWSIVLQIIGVRELQEINSKKAFAAMIIAVMVPLIHVVLIAMYLFGTSALRPFRRHRIISYNLFS